MASSNEVLQRVLARANRPEMLDIMAKVAPNLPNKASYRDFNVGLRSSHRYITEFVPEILGGGLRIVEVGPGVGCFMVLAKAFSNEVYGEEGPSTGVVNSYHAVTKAWGLTIRYGGFPSYFMEDQPPQWRQATTWRGWPYQDGTVDLFHFRGSLDAILHPFRDDFGTVIPKLLTLLRSALRPGGFIWISHNDDSLLEPTLKALAQHKGTLILKPTPRNMTRLVKP